MFSDKKKLADVIVSKGLGKPGPPVEPDGDEGEAPAEGADPALEAAAEDLMAAVKSDDAAGVASALRAAFDCCGNGGSVD